MLSKTQKRNIKISNKENKEYVESEKQDHFYYNILMNNLRGFPIPAEYISTSNQIILDDPSQYTVSIVRFQLLSKALPIFNFVPQPGSPTTGNTNPNLGIYSVTMNFGTTYVRQYVIFSPDFDASGLPPNIMNWFSLTDSNFKYYQVFEYQTFLNMINAALAMCYHNMPPMSPPKVAGAPAPYLYLDPVSHIISLVAHRSFDSKFIGPTIRIYMNHLLYGFFNNFDIILNHFSSANGDDFQILIGESEDSSVILPGLDEMWSPWYSYTTYEVGDLVSRARINYRSITASNLGNNPTLTNLVNWFAEDQTWNTVITYIINDTVMYLGSRYLSLQNGNVGNNPQSGPAGFWRLIAPNGSPWLWDAFTTYALNNITFYQGFWYRSLQNANIGNAPGSPLFWTLYASGESIPTWDPTVAYTIDNIILYQGSYYRSLTSPNTANSPLTSFTNWVPYTGFNSYLVSQQYSALFNWNDIQTIVFTSSLVPVVNENVPIQNISTSSLSQIQSSSRPILTDFAVGSSLGFDIKEPLTFTNQGEYRLINMTSTSPLSSVDIKIYWTNSRGEFFPVFLDVDPNSCCTIKLLFRRKDFNQSV